MTTPENNPALEPEAAQGGFTQILGEIFGDKLSLSIIGTFTLLALIIIIFLYPTGYRPARNTRLADKALIARDYDRAIPYLQAIVQQYPGAWMRQKVLGDCFLMKKQPDPKAALEQYQQVMQSPGFQDYINNPNTPPEDKLEWNLNEEMGICYAQLGDTKRAQEYLAKVLAQTPDKDNPAVNYYMGVEYFKAGNLRQAAQCFQYAATGDKDQAPEVNATEAPKQGSKWADYWDKLAQPYRQQIAKAILSAPLAAATPAAAPATAPAAPAPAATPKAGGKG